MDRYEPEAVTCICTNLAKACRKQHRLEEAELFDRLAAHYGKERVHPEEITFSALEEQVRGELAEQYPVLEAQAEEVGDRGVKRALTWGKKVTAIQKSLLTRFLSQKEKMLTGKKLFVCEACGFISLGAEPPEVCPICKAPARRFSHIA